MANSERIYLIQGNDTDMSVCLRKGGDTPLPYDLTGASRIGLALTGHGLSFFARDIVVSGEDNNIISGLLAGDLLVGEYGLEVSFTLDGKAKRFRVPLVFEVVTYLSEDADGTAEGEGDGISITVTVQPESIEIAGPTGPQGHEGKSAYEVWLDDGHTGTEDDFFEWLAAQTPNPDWEQNDTSEPDYIENRTHYDIPAVSLPDAFITFSGTAEDFSDLMFFLNDETPMPRVSEDVWAVQLGQWLLSCYINGNVLEVDLDGDPILTVANFRPGSTPQPILVGDIEVPELVQQLDGKYLALKTVNGQSVKGSGDITLNGGNLEYTGNDGEYISGGDSINGSLLLLDEAVDETNGRLDNLKGSEVVYDGEDGDCVILHGETVDQCLKELDDRAAYITENYQSKINDIDTIRAGAALGATAYQKPSSGIPASDLAAGVIPTQAQADWEEDDPAADDYIKNKPTIPTNVVKYTEQTLTDAQKTQARTNIAAASESEVSQLRSDVDELEEGIFKMDGGERQLTLTKTAACYASKTATAYVANSNGWYVMWYKATKAMRIRYKLGIYASSGAAQIAVSTAEPAPGVALTVLVKEQSANAEGYIDVNQGDYVGSIGSSDGYIATMWEQIVEEKNILNIVDDHDNHRVASLAGTYFNGVRLVDTLTRQRFGKSTATKIGNFVPVSATETTITLSAEDAACIVNTVILACKMNDGGYVFAYFSAASSNVITKLYDFGQDIDCQDIVEMQCIYDSLNGQGGIHLSPYGYRAMAHDIYDKLQTLQPFTDVFVGGWVSQFCQGSTGLSDNVIRDADGNLLCTPILSGIVTSNQACRMIYKANTPAEGPFYRTYYHINQTSPNGASVTFPIKALYPFKGMLRVEMSRAPGATGAAILKVMDIDTNLLLYTKDIPYYADSFFFDLSDKYYNGVNVKIEMPDATSTDVRISAITLSETYAKIAQIRPIDNTSTVALLGSSNTQYPNLNVAESLCPGDADNVVITRPDGTTGNGCGYMGKELARISGAVVDNWGKSGEQTAWGLTQLDKIFGYKKYTHIILSLFANDFNSGKTIAATTQRIRQMVEYAKSQGCVPILLMSYGYNTSASGNRYYAFHDSLLEGLDSVFIYTSSEPH